MSLKINPQSDLHLEFQKQGKYVPAFLGEDVLVLAGDINLGLDEFDSWFVDLLETRDVVYVIGNHELYRQDMYDIYNKFPLWAARINEQAEVRGYKFKIYALQNTSVVIKDVKFIGATLWTDYNKQDPEVMQMAPGMLNDYKLITYNHEKITSDVFLQEHLASRNFIEAELANSGDIKTVVVTHHLPSYGSVAQQYRVEKTWLSVRDIQNRNMNYLFYSDLDNLVAKADFWIHGHTHSSASYDVGKCKVFCNPYGYSNYEVNREFKTDLIIEV